MKNVSHVEIGNLTSAMVLDALAHMILMGEAELAEWSMSRPTFRDFNPSSHRMQLEITMKKAPPVYTDASAQLEHAKLMAAHWQERVKQLQGDSRRHEEPRVVRHHKDGSRCSNDRCRRAHLLGLPAV